MIENILNMEILGVSLILYLIGSIPFAIVTSKLFSLQDPRSFGSGNPGATNVLRSGNKPAAILTLLGDALKGYIPVLLLDQMGLMQHTIYLMTFLILLGHAFPITLNFKGGKGVATSMGILLALNLLVGVILIIIWIIVYYTFRISGVSAIVSFVFLPLLMYMISNNPYMVALSFVNTIFIIMTHKSNIISFFSDKP